MAIRDVVIALGSSGFDKGTIAVALNAAATHEMLVAFGKERAANLAAKMFAQTFLVPPTGEAAALRGGQ